MPEQCAINFSSIQDGHIRNQESVPLILLAFKMDISVIRKVRSGTGFKRSIYGMDGNRRSARESGFFCLFVKCFANTEKLCSVYVGSFMA